MYTNTSIQLIHQTLSESSPKMETVLKLILKEWLNTNAVKKMSKKPQTKGNVAFTTTTANPTTTVATTKVVSYAVPKPTTSKTAAPVPTFVFKQKNLCHL